MLNPWLLLVAVIAIGGAFVAGDIHGHKSEATTWKANIEQARADASEEARTIEREQQRRVNDALQKQYWVVAGVRDDLLADLERLRDRPERSERPVPDTTGATCETANGAELAREYAEFLTRYAAKSAEQDAALEGCQAYADAVSALWKGQNK